MRNHADVHTTPQLPPCPPINTATRTLTTQPSHPPIYTKHENKYKHTCTTLDDQVRQQNGPYQANCPQIHRRQGTAQAARHQGRFWLGFGVGCWVPVWATRRHTYARACTHGICTRARTRTHTKSATQAARHQGQLWLRARVGGRVWAWVRGPVHTHETTHTPTK